MVHAGRRTASAALVSLALAVLAGALVAACLAVAQGRHADRSGARTRTGSRTTRATSSWRAGSSTPPAGDRICGRRAVLSGPSSPPAGAVVVPAGLNHGSTLASPGTTYWFAPGTHTLGTAPFSQIAPADGDRYIGSPGAVLSGQGLNDYAFTGSATHVVIKHLTVTDFTAPEGQMVVNHTADSTSWKIEYDTVETSTQGAGVGVGTGDVIEHDCLTRNAEYGFSSFSGATAYTLSHDEISYNDGTGRGRGMYDQGGSTIACGCSGGGKLWESSDGSVTTDWVHDNGGVGIWADTDNRGLLVAGNDIDRNYAEGIVYELSYNAIISGNTLVDNAWGKGSRLDGFPTGAIYISESGGDPRVRSDYRGVLRVTRNVLRTNWGGVVLWESSNRYCGDGSDPACTLVTPATYTTGTCRARLAGSRPNQMPDYYDNCRWKTRTVLVAHNTFSFTPTGIPACTVESWCGFNALFSEYGSTTPWKGWAVPLDVADRQHDRFRTNTYRGPWHFDGFNQGDVVTWTRWTHGFTDWNGSNDHFAGQDQGSTRVK